MESIAVIFWSGTGNTATMAQEVVAGTGGQAKLINVTDTNADEAAAYDKLALGCPSMGDEVLEEGRSVRLLRLGRRPVDARLGRAHQEGRCHPGS